MTKILAYKTPNHPVVIEQSKVQRDWMDETAGKHVYKCFPLSLANQVGWTISFTKDIEFVWDGITDTTPDHVTILQSGGLTDTNRANATITFHSGIQFKTDEDMSVLCIPPANLFIDGLVPYTSVISTSFLDEPYPIAWRITKPNHKFLIKAGTPIATFIPISLKRLSEIELDVYDKVFEENYHKFREERGEAWAELTAKGGFTNFYRDAVDHKGNSIGKHEVKSLTMKINDFTTSSQVV
jgi:hypothetical protein